jgi:hypothetical protein
VVTTIVLEYLFGFLREENSMSSVLAQEVLKSVLAGNRKKQGGKTICRKTPHSKFKVKYLRQKQEPTYSFVILTLVLILINTALAWLSVTFFPAGTSGVALVYLAVVTMILSALWFGAYGAIAAYIGTLLGGLISTPGLVQRPEIAVIWAVAGLLQVLIPLVAVRMFEVDLTLPNRRDWAIVLLFAVLINNIAGAAWGTFTLSLIAPLNFTSVFSTWVVSNIIITLVLVPLALRFLTEKVSKSKLFVKQYWD